MSCITCQSNDGTSVSCMNSVTPNTATVIKGGGFDPTCLIAFSRMTADVRVMLEYSDKLRPPHFPPSLLLVAFICLCRMAPLSQVAPMHRDKMHVTGTHGSGTPVALPSRGPSRINLLEMPSSMLYEPIKGQQLRSHRRLSDPPTSSQESRRRSTGRTPC